MDKAAVPALLRRPLPLGTLIALASLALFGWHLTVPGILVFDEVHYVPAARTLLALARPVNAEHPLLGKELIAAGIVLFGDGPLGWRAPSALAGAATIGGVFALLWLGTRRRRPAVVASLFAVLGFTVFVQARIAMLDGFMAAFTVCGAACVLWAMRARTRAAAWRRWTAAGLLLGLATACKWAAAPYVAFAAVAFLLLRRRRPERWAGLPALPALAVLGGTSVAAYALTFLPAFFYADQPLTLAGLPSFQIDMYRLQAQVLPSHAYQSSWWTWPLDLRPIWYLYERVDGAQRGVLMLGNPIVLWGGLAAVAACGWDWLRTRNTATGAAAGLWLAGFLIWAAIPKSLGFFYYYYLPSLWLCVALAAAFDRWRVRLRYWDEMMLVAAATLFVHFYPILAATPLAGERAFLRWMWLRSWA